MTIRWIAALMAALLATGCMISPGTFTSELMLDKSGRFEFAYQGEISILGFSNLLDMAAAAETEDFEGECMDDNFEERPCTEAEVEEQRAAKAAENARDAEMFKAMLGGIDPSSPEAIDTFIERVSRQKGWNSISHKENGVFDVDFRITGMADQGFTFPLIEKLQGVNPFVTVIARKDGKVRIEAPGFASGEQGAMGMGSLAMLAGMGSPETGGPDVPPKLTLPNGTFTVRTNGSILTNNTEEGPMTEDGESVLRWEITPSTSQPPETLIGLD
ncbi:MAG: hypothetical protein AAFX04_03675 [Pseudomonadota bacterium]